MSNWASHVSGLDPSFLKIWTCGSSPRSGSWNAWTRIKNVNGASRLCNFRFFRRDPNVFLSRLVTMDETWLYHYDPETKQQSMEWRHSGSLRPKVIPSAKISWKSSRLDFFKSRRYPPHWLSSKGPNYQTWSINHLCWCNWMIFWRKSAAKISPRWSCSCTKMLRLTGHLQPRRKWPTWVSNVLITHPILRIWPRRTTTCSLHWKSN